MAEHYVSGLEVRAEGRRLQGPALHYNEVSPGHREYFERGAFDLGDDRTRWLNLEHRGLQVLAFTGGGGLRLTDTHDALMVRADLPAIPAAERALQDVKAGRLTGFSIEFTALRERRDNQLRVVEKAALAGIGLVARPSYKGSQAELRFQQRGRSGLTMRASIPSDTDLDCECSGAGCKFARFTSEALQQAVDDALDEVSRTKDTIAAFGSFAQPLASTSKGTLRGRMVGSSMEIDIDVPDSEAGRAMMAAHDDAGVVVRPFLDAELSDSTEIPREDGANAMAYSRAHVRAFIVSATDKRAGWPDPEVIASEDRGQRRIVVPKRRLPLWA